MNNKCLITLGFYSLHLSVLSTIYPTLTPSGTFAMGMGPDRGVDGAARANGGSWPLGLDLAGPAGIPSQSPDMASCRTVGSHV